MKLRIGSLGVCTLCCLSWNLNAQYIVDPDPAIEIPAIPNSIGALGDSMTAAALASYKRQEGILPWKQVSFLLTVIEYGLTKDYGVLESRELSCATGITDGARVVSHAHRLGYLNLEREVQIYNAAVSGEIVDDVLHQQWPAMREWSERELGQAAPDYVTILIGANDVCADKTDQMTSTNDYYNKLYRTVEDIMVRSPKTRIMISTLPNIEKLRKVAANARLMGWGPFSKCQDLWRTINLCYTLTLEDNFAERQKVKERVDDFNIAMHEVARSINADFADHVRVTNKTFEVDFTANDLSMDCFHPNPLGQEKLSKVTWSDTWWGKNWTPVKDMDIRRKTQTNKKCYGRDSRGDLTEVACPKSTNSNLQIN